MKRGWFAGVVVLVPGGGVLVGAWWLYRRWRVQKLTETIDNATPPHIAQWAPQLAAAAQASCPPQVKLDAWAMVLCAIIERESKGGLLLSPRGAAGLGDHGHGHGLGQVDDRPAGEGRSDYERALSEKRLAHIESGDWMDPAKHLRFVAVEVLRGAFDQFGDIADIDARVAAAVAAYNAGVDHVRAALDSGADVSSVTTGDDYAVDVLAHSDAWLSAAPAA